MLIAIVGNVIKGFELVGPFDHEREADAAMNDQCRLVKGLAYRLAEVSNPAEFMGKKIPEVSIEMKNIVDDLVAEKDDGACPDEECSGGIVEGICSHCEDEWAYKLVEAKPPSKTLLGILAREEAKNSSNSS